MAYSRWASLCDAGVCPSCPGSDVYIFDHVDGGISCCGCFLARDAESPYETNFETAEEMQAHLALHVAAGHHVPVRFLDGGFTEMWNLYNGKDAS